MWVAMQQCFHRVLRFSEANEGLLKRLGAEMEVAQEAAPVKEEKPYPPEDIYIFLLASDLASFLGLFGSRRTRLLNSCTLRI
jgi:hypothetical protein